MTYNEFLKNEKKTPIKAYNKRGELKPKEPNFTQEENEELIKDISSIAAFNNPTMKSMVEEMQKSALQSRS